MTTLLGELNATNVVHRSLEVKDGLHDGMTEEATTDMEETIGVVATEEVAMTGGVATEEVAMIDDPLAVNLVNSERPAARVQAMLTTGHLVT
jgi:hypothetical protein